MFGLFEAQGVNPERFRSHPLVAGSFSVHGDQTLLLFGVQVECHALGGDLP